MKFQCPFCHQNLKASPDPLPHDMYDLCCPPHARIRFNKDHELIEYNLYTDVHGLAGYCKDYCLNYQGVPFMGNDETILYKLTSPKWTKIIELQFFMSFQNQKELDSLMERLLNLKAFS